MEVGKFRFKAVVGMLCRKQFRDVLLDMKYQFKYRGREFTIEESKGFFDSIFFVNGTCSKSEGEALEKWGEQWSD